MIVALRPTHNPAADALVVQHTWLVRRLVVQLGCRNRHEGISAGNLALVESSRSYQPHKGPFIPYASRAIKRAVNGTIAREASRSTQRLTSELAEETPPETPYDMERLTAALERLPAELGILVRERFGLGDFQASTLEEIGQRHGMSREAVRQRITKALAAIGQAMS